MNSIEHMCPHLSIVSDYTESCGRAVVVALQNGSAESDQGATIAIQHRCTCENSTWLLSSKFQRSKFTAEQSSACEDCRHIGVTCLHSFPFNFLTISRSKEIITYFLLLTQEIAEEAQQIFFPQKTIHYQSIEHTHEEYVIQVPIQGTNISVMQPATADQLMNSIMHSGQTETINVDMSTPLYILAPGAPLTIQIPTNEDVLPVAPVVEIPIQNDTANEVLENFQKKKHKRFKN